MRRVCRSAVMGPCCARSRHRSPDDIIDALGACGQHDQPVEAERAAAGRRHMGERGQEILVDGIAFAVDAGLSVICFEASRCSAGSVSSPKPLASSTPQA